jgi:hypothetical protein
MGTTPLLACARNQHSIHDLKFFEARDLIEAIVSDSAAYPDFRDGWRIQKIIDAVDLASNRRSWISLDLGKSQRVSASTKVQV